MFRFRPGRVCLVIAAVVVFAAACASGDDGAETTEGTESTSDEASGEPVPGGTLRYAIGGETNTWDPAAGQWSDSSWAVARTFYDLLVSWDEDSRWKAYLAESIEPNEDHTAWTITPRDGVTFHNGEVLDAELIKANLDRHLISPLTGTVFEAVESIEVVDGKVEIALDRSWVNFPVTLTGQPGIMVARETLEDPDGFLHPIGTGPFVFEDWVIDDQLSVRANPDYWNGPVYLDGVEFRVIVDHETRARAIESGEFDVAPFSLADQIVGLQEQVDAGDLLYLVDDGEGDEVFFLINMDRPPFDDIRVREALILATDRQAGIDATGEGLYDPADGLYAPDSPWYADSAYPGYDPDRARELVEEWEAENGEPLKITMGSPQEPSTIRNLQFYQGQWEDVGIETEIVATEGTEYINQTLLGNYDVNIWQFYGVNHPDGEYVWMHSDFAAEPGSLALNFGRIRDEGIDAALDEARAESDVDRQRELYGEVQRLMTEGRYHIFLYHDINVLSAVTDVEGLAEWSFADGTTGKGMENTRTKLTEVWLAPSD